MRKFWMFIGKSYMFFKNLFSKKGGMSILAVIIILQFIFLIIMLIQLSTLKSSFESYKTSSLQTLNRTYSQVWLLNSKLSKDLKN